MFNINAVVLILIICEDLRNWLNVYLNFSFFTVFLKIRNIISKIKRSKVTDYAALTHPAYNYCKEICMPDLEKTVWFGLFLQEFYVL